MSRILWLGDAGATTGFARVAHAVGDRLVRNHGHEVHTLAVNYDGDAGKWDTAMKLYLATRNDVADVYGTRRFVEMLAEVMPDVVIMLNDPYVILKHLFRNRWDEQLMLVRSAGRSSATCRWTVRTSRITGTRSRSTSRNLHR